MRALPFALLAAATAATAAAPPAAAREHVPVTRTCSSSAYGDLGRDWRTRAVTAGPVSFVGMRDGVRRVPPAEAGRGWPVKVLLVLDPGRVATVTIAARSLPYARLAHGALPPARPVPLGAGHASVRFEPCRTVSTRPVWNRGTQFPGYVLVSGPRCVDVVVTVPNRVGAIVRTLRFGVARCA